MFSSSDELQAVPSELTPSIKYMLVNVNAFAAVNGGGGLLFAFNTFCACDEGRAAAAGWKARQNPLIF